MFYWSLKGTIESLRNVINGDGCVSFPNIVSVFKSSKWHEICGWNGASKDHIWSDRKSRNIWNLRIWTVLRQEINDRIGWSLKFKGRLRSDNLALSVWHSQPNYRIFLDETEICARCLRDLEIIVEIFSVRRPLHCERRSNLLHRLQVYFSRLTRPSHYKTDLFIQGDLNSLGT